MHDQDRLKELMFLLNNQGNSDKSGHPEEKFFKGTPPSLVINHLHREMDHKELMAEHEHAVEILTAKIGNKDKAVFNVGQRVMLQSQVGPKVWEERGTIKECRQSDDRMVQSYSVLKNNGISVLWNKRFLKLLS